MDESNAKQIDQIKNLYQDAFSEQLQARIPQCLQNARVAAEGICSLIYMELFGKLPDKLMTLENYLTAFKNNKELTNEWYPPLESIQKYGNLGSHHQIGVDVKALSKEYVQPCLAALDTLINSYFSRYTTDHLVFSQGNIFPRQVASSPPDKSRTQQRLVGQRRKIFTAMVVSVVITILSVCVYWYLKSYVWEDVAYCNTYAKRFGIMECVGKLTQEQVQGRASSLKFIRRGTARPVHRVQAINSTGEYNTQHWIGTYLKSASWINGYESRRECQWEFVVDAKGSIVYEKAFNKNNRLVWSLVYSPASNGEKKNTRAHYVNADGFPEFQTRSTAKFIKFEYSNKGDEIARYYVDDNDEPQPALDGAFGRHQEFDERGLVTYMTSLDAEKRPMNGVYGVSGEASLKLAYDNLGNITELTGFDTNGQPTVFLGYHKAISKFDTRGNEVEKTYFGTNGQPVIFRLGGYHKAISKFDTHGNTIEVALFGTNGQPVFSRHGGCHKVISQFDAQNSKTEAACFDTNGQPIIYKHGGYHKATFQSDARGNLIETAYFGTNGQPILSKEGLHKWISLFDAQGNEVEKAYFDANGQPLLKDGYHKVISQFNSRGNEVEKTYFDRNGQPILLKDGYHKAISKFDTRGNLIETAYFGTNGQPVLSKEGLHKWISRFDAQGDEVEKTYFGTNGQPILLKDGYHIWVRLYDERGNEIENSFFGTNGQPILPILLKEGYHKWTAQFDARDNQTEVAYFGTNGQPVLLKEGYHKRTAQFDARGNQTEVAYFGTGGQPILLKDGYHKSTSQYDARGNKIEETYFDTKNQPAIRTGCHCHKIKLEYNKEDRETNRFFFDIAGQPVDGKPPHSK